ncbi:hypothetical protein [Photobacterium damselae]|uniref:hypothetical protein n=1 Tax=Photobacterium damselae TaxID=38293 RepID=UPI001F38F085|nr:hypothetical protein [Photobacterium damselae]UKA04779.1 hypothetical protein IHC89_21290 [Photobacterium damselae subsp. damselae]
MAREYKQLHVESVGTTSGRKIYWYLVDGVKYGVLEGAEGIGYNVLDEEYKSISLDDAKKSLYSNVILHHIEQSKRS